MVRAVVEPTHARGGWRRRHSTAVDHCVGGDAEIGGYVWERFSGGCFECGGERWWR